MHNIYSLSKFHLYNMLLSTVVMMLYIWWKYFLSSDLHLNLTVREVKLINWDSTTGSPLHSEPPTCAWHAKSCLRGRVSYRQAAVLSLSNRIKASDLCLHWWPLWFPPAHPFLPSSLLPSLSPSFALPPFPASILPSFLPLLPPFHASFYSFTHFLVSHFLNSICVENSASCCLGGLGRDCGTL